MFMGLEFTYRLSAKERMLLLRSWNSVIPKISSNPTGVSLVYGTGGALVCGKGIWEQIMDEVEGKTDG